MLFTIFSIRILINALTQGRALLQDGVNLVSTGQVLCQCSALAPSQFACQAEPCFRMGCIWFLLGKSCVNALRWRLPSSHARQSLASGWGAFGFHWASPASMLCVGAFPVRMQGRALLQDGVHLVSTGQVLCQCSALAPSQFAGKEEPCFMGGLKPSHMWNIPYADSFSSWQWERQTHT
jgi:hypothetical protein